MTYTDPIPKIKKRPSFCFSGICSPDSIGMGKTNRMTSDPTLQTAVAIYSAAVLRQCPSTIVGSQLFRIGVHAKRRAKKIQLVYPTMMNIVANTP